MFPPPEPPVVVLRGALAAGTPSYDAVLAEHVPLMPGGESCRSCGFVYTGQRIGSVGQTGNANGCHLHFELWNAPGWYEGGAAFDPLPALMAWDGWS